MKTKQAKKAKPVKLRARNPKFNHLGTIDLEYDSPQHGWVPFTAAPDDVEEHGRRLYEMALRGDFGPIAPGPSRADILAIRRHAAALDRLEFKRRLDAAGQYDAVERVVNAPDTPRRLQIHWTEARVFERLHPDAVELLQRVGMTAPDIDALFGVEADQQASGVRT